MSTGPISLHLLLRRSARHILQEEEEEEAEDEDEEEQRTRTKKNKKKTNTWERKKTTREADEHGTRGSTSGIMIPFTIPRSRAAATSPRRTYHPGLAGVRPVHRQCIACRRRRSPVGLQALFINFVLNLIICSVKHKLIFLFLFSSLLFSLSFFSLRAGCSLPCFLSLRCVVF